MRIHPRHQGPHRLELVSTAAPVYAFRVDGDVYRCFSRGDRISQRRTLVALDGDVLCALLDLLTDRAPVPLSARQLILLLDAIDDMCIRGNHIATLLAHADATAPFICIPALPGRSEVADVFHLAERLNSNVLLKAAMGNILNGFWNDLAVVRRWSAQDKAKIGRSLFEALQHLYGDEAAPWAPAAHRELTFRELGVVQIYQLDADWHIGNGRRVQLEDTFFD